MSWKLKHSKRAEKQLRALDSNTRQKVLDALDLLKLDPLRGKQLGPPHKTRRSWRTGDYRIIYEISGDRLLILVIAIGHRREVYLRVREAMERWRTSSSSSVGVEVPMNPTA